MNLPFRPGVGAFLNLSILNINRHKPLWQGQGEHVRTQARAYKVQERTCGVRGVHRGVCVEPGKFEALSIAHRALMCVVNMGVSSHSALGTMNAQIAHSLSPRRPELLRHESPSATTYIDRSLLQWSRLLALC